MKNNNLLLVISMFMLMIVQSCKKNEAPGIRSAGTEKSKATTGIPPGALTGTIPNGTYKILSYVTTIDPATNKYLGIVSNSTANFAKLEQRDVVGNAQRWRVTNLGNGEYEIVNINSGKLVDLNLGQDTEGVQIQQYNALLGNPQKWIIEPQGGYPLYRIKSKVNPLKGLHVEAASTANGALITLNTLGGGAMQGAGYFLFYPEVITTNPILDIDVPAATKTNVYPRVIRLTNGDLLASFQNVDSSIFAGNAVVKIYKSTNSGGSWSLLSTVTDTHRSLGTRDPEIFELPVAIGTMPAGTLILGIRSMGFLTPNFIDMYKSTNGGVSWTFVSNIDAGLRWQRNIYEPHFIVDNTNRLLCYYASELDSATHSQKIVYRSTTNGTTWSSTVDVTAVTPRTRRPGMPRITKMGNGQYMLVYEVVGSADCCSRIYFKTSTDGFNWGASTSLGTLITAVDGSAPGGTPSVLWTPAGSPQGTVIVTSVFNVNPGTTEGSDNYINYNYGAGSWYRIKQPLPFTPNTNASPGYSRSLGLSADGQTVYHINCVDIDNNRSKTRFVAMPAW